MQASKCVSVKKMVNIKYDHERIKPGCLETGISSKMCESLKQLMRVVPIVVLVLVLVLRVVPIVDIRVEPTSPPKATSSVHGVFTSHT